MAACLIDIRCLQDPAFLERGVGRHARALLDHARECMPGIRLVGIVDPVLAPPAAAVRQLLDDVRGSAYTGALTVPTVFAQLSPMTHDPMFVARLLHHPAIPAATVVYDFIPLDEPDRYLPAPEPRLAYHVSLRWLARYQRFLPISNASGARLQELLGIPESRIAVTGAPLAPGFEGMVAGRARHVLVVAGADPRKNPDVVIRAHARSRAVQAAAVPLVVTGAYDHTWLAERRAMAAASGGDPSLVEAPGHLDERALLNLYANAACVVVPSRSEGFSLPVIEAMAASVPVLASDIPAHRELLPRTLFPPDADDVLANLLDQIADPEWRSRTLADQADVWPRFRARDVSVRFWTVVAALTPHPAPARPARRPRVALLTPLPPDRSGVADYSAATCLELGKRVDLHVFAPNPAAPCPPGAASVAPLSALPQLSSRFDRVVHVVGNSLFHLGILRLLLRYGGAAIQHDGRMLDLYAAHAGFKRTERMAEAELGRPLLPNELGHWLAGDLPPGAMLLSEVAEAAEPLMMHSAVSIAEVERRYRRGAVHLPFSLYRTLPEPLLTPAARAAARERLGVADNQILLVSFGAIHRTKAPEECIWALDVLRGWGVDARLHFVGAPLMALEPLQALVSGLGLGPHVLLGDSHVTEASYRSHLVAANVALQLRTTGPGSLSGALADAIGAGLPSVASVSLAGGMDAPDYVHAIPDAPSPVLIAEAALEQLGAPPTADSRRAYAAGHGFDRYAARLCEALDLA